jgi:hypothetical protein
VSKTEVGNPVAAVFVNFFAVVVMARKMADKLIKYVSIFSLPLSGWSLYLPSC